MHHKLAKRPASTTTAALCMYKPNKKTAADANCEPSTTLFTCSAHRAFINRPVHVPPFLLALLSSSSATQGNYTRGATTHSSDARHTREQPAGVRGREREREHYRTVPDRFPTHLPKVFVVFRGSHQFRRKTLSEIVRFDSPCRRSCPQERKTSRHIALTVPKTRDHGFRKTQIMACKIHLGDFPRQSGALLYYATPPLCRIAN